MSDQSKAQNIRYCHVRSELHKYLIGKGGQNINEIRRSSGARITFPKPGDPRVDPNKIEISGTNCQIQLAMGQIIKFLQTLPKNFTHSEMEVDPKYHNYFVGQDGKVCKELSAAHDGIFICFPKGADAQSNPSRVKLKGSPEAIEATKKKIESIVSHLSSLSTVQVIIPQRFHANVIGYRGVNAQTLQAEHNVYIKFPTRPADYVPNMVPATTEDKSLDIIYVTGQLKDCEIVKQLLLLSVPNVPKEIWRPIAVFNAPDAATNPNLVPLGSMAADVEAADGDLPKAVKRQREGTQVDVLNRLMEIAQDSQPLPPMPLPLPAPPKPKPFTNPSLHSIAKDGVKPSRKPRTSKRSPSSLKWWAKHQQQHSQLINTICSTPIPGYVRRVGNSSSSSAKSSAAFALAPSAQASLCGEIPTPENLGGGYNYGYGYANRSDLDPAANETLTIPTRYMTPSGKALHPWLYGGSYYNADNGSSVNTTTANDNVSLSSNLSWTLHQ